MAVGESVTPQIRQVDMQKEMELLIRIEIILLQLMSLFQSGQYTQLRECLEYVSELKARLSDG